MRKSRKASQCRSGGRRGCEGRAKFANAKVDAAAAAGDLGNVLSECHQVKLVLDVRKWLEASNHANALLTGLPLYG